MQSLPHSALNTNQLAQVAYLFADEIFGTDASGFVYLVNDAGAVTGRRYQAERLQVGKFRAAGEVRVTTQEDEATDEFISMHMSAGALIALLTERLMINNFEEVHHEQ